MLKPTINFTVVQVFAWTGIVALFVACMSRSNPDGLNLLFDVCGLISFCLLAWYALVTIGSRGKAVFAVGYVVTYLLLVLVRYANDFNVPSMLAGWILSLVPPHGYPDPLTGNFITYTRSNAAIEFARVLCSVAGGLASILATRLYGAQDKAVAAEGESNKK